MSFKNILRDSLVAAAFGGMVVSGMSSPATAVADTGVDTSAAAQQNFQTWWRYENVIPADKSVSDAQAYRWAVAACNIVTSQGASPETITAGISSNSGLSPTGAGGVYKSALEALCPQQKGYKSYFDRQVDSFANLMNQQYHLSPEPRTADYGYLMRRVCEGLQGGYNHNTVIPWLKTLNETTIPRAYGLTDAQLYDIVNAATVVWCSSN